jgi:hypothetical protein
VAQPALETAVPQQGLYLQQQQQQQQPEDQQCSDARAVAGILLSLSGTTT